MGVAQKAALPLVMYQVALAIWLLGPQLWAQETGTRSDYPVVSAKIGEHCTVCGVALTEKDVALIVRGRRVPLNKEMVDTFLNDQEKYFSQKQPKGALFQEELRAPAGVAQGGISLGWFLLGLYVLLGLIGGGLSAYIAVSKSLRSAPYFFIGFFFNALGYLYVLTRPSRVVERIPSGLVKVPTTQAPLACPACGNTNHPTARRCAACGDNLQPASQSEVARV